MYARQAETMFEENVRLFADPRSQPEKYNLYAGLANLARELQAVRSELADLRNRVDNLRR